MAAQVVCVSQTTAALGEEIGTLVAERLSFRYVDEQVIARAARLAQMDPKLVAAVEQRQPLLRGLMEKLAAARGRGGGGRRHRHLRSQPGPGRDGWPETLKPRRGAHSAPQDLQRERVSSWVRVYWWRFPRMVPAW